MYARQDLAGGQVGRVPGKAPQQGQECLLPADHQVVLQLVGILIGEVVAHLLSVEGPRSLGKEHVAAGRLQLDGVGDEELQPVHKVGQLPQLLQ